MLRTQCQEVEHVLQRALDKFARSVSEVCFVHALEQPTDFEDGEEDACDALAFFGWDEVSLVWVWTSHRGV